MGFDSSYGLHRPIKSILNQVSVWEKLTFKVIIFLRCTKYQAYHSRLKSYTDIIKNKKLGAFNIYELSYIHSKGYKYVCVYPKVK